MEERREHGTRLMVLAVLLDIGVEEGTDIAPGEGSIRFGERFGQEGRSG